MAKKPTARSQQQVERDRLVRKKYQDRPSLSQLAEAGDHEPSIKQGEYLALMEFAARVKARREQLKLSLTELATRTGIDKGALSRLENGVSENPTISTLHRIAQSLGQRLKIDLGEDLSASARH